MNPADFALPLPQSNCQADNPSGRACDVSCREPLPQSEIERPRVRGDLKWTFSPRSVLQPTALWIAFDPITRQCYRFGETEYWLIQQMRGHSTLQHICDRFEKEFSGQEIAHSELQKFCQHLWNRQLLCRDTRSAPTNISRQNRYLKSWLSPSSWVSWRARGVNIDRLLDRLRPLSCYFFARWAVGCWLVFCLSVSMLVLLDFPRLAQQTVEWNWLTQPTQFGNLFCVFLLTRALHEFGHAMVCKRFGIRCPDIGVFVVLGAPCVYCDVSESWRLPAAWQRAAVASAGMYVELIVAALAGIIWLATVESSINTIALQTMLICSVSTLLINANPLMRFDGYYILSDLTNEANLRSRADEACLRELYLCLLGRKAVAGKPVVMPAFRRRWLVGFSAAGWIYRASLTVVIASILVSLYESWYLSWFGRFLAVSIIIAWWGIPMVRLLQGLARTAWQVGTMLRLSLVAILLIAAFLTLPIAGRSSAKGWLQPSQMSGLFAPTTGQLIRIATRDGQSLDAGDVVFEIDDYQVRLAQLAIDSRVQKGEAQLAAARRSRYFTSVDLPTLEKSTTSLKQQSLHARRHVEKLTLRAPIAGRLLALQAPPILEPDGARQAPTTQVWTDPSQLGRQVSQGTMLGAICSTDATAIIPLDDTHLASVAAGTAVRIRAMTAQSTVFHCRVDSVVQLSELDAAWRLLTAHDPGSTQGIATTPKDTSTPATVSSLVSGYAAVIHLPKECRATPGAQIQAVFVLPSRTAFQLATQWCYQNLRWLAD